MSDNPFHDHLDVCEQCREHPFSLCLVGEQKMKEAVAVLAVSGSLLSPTEARFLLERNKR